MTSLGRIGSSVTLLILLSLIVHAGYSGPVVSLKHFYIARHRALTPKEISISASFRSEIISQTDTGEIVGSAKASYEEITLMQLTRELRGGEIVTLIDKTRDLTGLPYKIEKPRPTAIDIAPEFAQAGAVVPVKIKGKYFAPDSKVLVDGQPASIKKAAPTEIICILPAIDKAKVAPHKPFFVDVEVRSDIAPSTSIEFTYVDIYDFRADLEQRGRKVRKR